MKEITIWKINYTAHLKNAMNVLITEIHKINFGSVFFNVRSHCRSFKG